MVSSNGLHTPLARGAEAVAVADADQIAHPQHYSQDNPAYEPAKVIRAWKLPWALGDAVKYIARAGRKGSRVQDLGKAAWYLLDEIAADPDAEPALLALYDKLVEHLLGSRR